MDDLPAVCGRCLGADSDVKMLRQTNGAECKTCTRPFNVYMWKPSNAAVKKHTKTIICLTCARARHCCQSCMLDITYGIPLDVRDAALKMAGIATLDAAGLAPAATNSKNREVKAIMADKLEAKYNTASAIPQSDAHDILTKLSHRLNDVKPKFLTAKPAKNHAVDISNIAAKLPFGGSIAPPADESLTLFFVFGIDDAMPQYVLSDYCEPFGKLKNITIVHRAKAGFITFVSRQGANLFAAAVASNGHNANPSTAGVLILDNRFALRVAWGKPQPLGTTKEEHQKLGLVVTKVLQQLAERDRAFERPQKQVPTTQRQQPKPRTTTKGGRPVYESASKDFEL